MPKSLHRGVCKTKISLSISLTRSSEAAYFSLRGAPRIESISMLGRSLLRTVLQRSGALQSAGQVPGAADAPMPWASLDAGRCASGNSVAAEEMRCTQPAIGRSSHANQPGEPNFAPVSWTHGFADGGTMGRSRLIRPKLGDHAIAVSLWPTLCQTSCHVCLPPGGVRCAACMA